MVVAGEVPAHDFERGEGLRCQLRLEQREVDIHLEGGLLPLHLHFIVAWMNS